MGTSSGWGAGLGMSLYSNTHSDSGIVMDLDSGIAMDLDLGVGMNLDSGMVMTLSLKLKAGEYLIPVRHLMELHSVVGHLVGLCRKHTAAGCPVSLSWEPLNAVTQKKKTILGCFPQNISDPWVQQWHTSPMSQLTMH